MACGVTRPLHGVTEPKRKIMRELAVEQELVKSAQAGDRGAFELLAVKYQRKLVRLLAQLVPDADEAETVAQEALVRAYRALPRLAPDAPFAAWLYRIGIKAAKDHLANRPAAVKPKAATEHHAVQTTTTDEPDHVSRQIITAVHTALQDLPEELRAALSLREIEGLGYEEISRITGCPVESVRFRIARARQLIAARLKVQATLQGRATRQADRHREGWLKSCTARLSSS